MQKNPTKRVKTVYRNAGEVTHVWAQQSGHDVHCSNARTNGTALYSYATPIANFVTNAKGKTAVLITTIRYSATTNSNMPTANDIPGGYGVGAWYNRDGDVTGKNVPVFHVEHIGITGGRAPYPSSKGYHADNMLIMQNEYMDLLKKLSRAKANATNYIDQLNALREKAQVYSKFFGVTFFNRKFPLVTAEVIERAKAVVQAETKRKSEANAARREREALDAEKYAAQFMRGELSYIPSVVWQSATIATLESLRKYIASQWRAGVNIHITHDYRAATMLRVKGDDIETSRGATFPLSHGLKALPYIRAIVASGEAWQRNGKTIHLGHYQIDRIANGEIVAGCHVIPIVEVEQLAASLGV